MDLGYGNSNQAMGNAAAQAILAQTAAQEDAIQTELAQYDTLLNSTDSELEKIRERRLAQMKKAAEQKSKWLSNGHGVYSSIGEGQNGADAAREFFEVTKQSDRVVVHFHRPSTRLCDVFHAHLEKLAASHPETRFVKINVDQCSADGGGGGATYLVEKLGIVVMPTLLIVKNRKAQHHVRGFDELGGTENFSVEALEFVLGGHGALTLPEGMEPPTELLEGRAGVNDVNVMRFSGGAGGGRTGRGAYGTSEDYEED